MVVFRILPIHLITAVSLRQLYQYSYNCSKRVRKIIFTFLILPVYIYTVKFINNNNNNDNNDNNKIPLLVQSTLSTLDCNV